MSAASLSEKTNASQTIASRAGEYRPEGYVHWPEDPALSFQFVRVLAASQEGASTIGECFLAASRIDPGDHETWHTAWVAMGDRSRERAERALAAGHVETARMNWLRAANYYRSGEFLLHPDDPRRLQTFDKVEACSHRYLRLLQPAGEIVRVPYVDGAHLDAYFLRAPGAAAPAPVVIAFGGLDEFKDELLHEMPKHAFPRGLSLLLVDLPGQGGTLRRQKIVNRHDTEVPVSACVDYLIARGDVDRERIALYGASLGGYYAPRAACFEPRIKAVVSDGAIWDQELLVRRLIVDHADSELAMLAKWVFGAATVHDVLEKSKAFKLDGVLDKLRCPYLITHGGADWLGLDVAHLSFDYAKRHGVDVTLKIFEPQETGAAHCQIDNPTLGQEFICDWIADRLGIDQARLPRAA